MVLKPKKASHHLAGTACIIPPHDNWGFQRSNWRPSSGGYTSVSCAEAALHAHEAGHESTRDLVRGAKVKWLHGAEPSEPPEGGIQKNLTRYMSHNNGNKEWKQGLHTCRCFRFTYYSQAVHSTPPLFSRDSQWQLWSTSVETSVSKLEDR